MPTGTGRQSSTGRSRRPAAASVAATRGTDARSQLAFCALDQLWLSLLLAFRFGHRFFIGFDRFFCGGIFFRRTFFSGWFVRSLLFSCRFSFRRFSFRRFLLRHLGIGACVGLRSRFFPFTGFLGVCFAGIAAFCFVDRIAGCPTALIWIRLCQRISIRSIAVIL